ncbi:hypothetical protein VM1G_11179 [Cytospora mali]|uniref:Uncharacterized protein n=1 Tax=Cytospora mali TaxID=578113 RepID=A0A194VK78_CYTMA|nr:hypothetical protein VM1G_11179 [Valsa mali]
MDPISAIGTASAILTFVDFAWELVAGAREIYKSADGVTDENAHIGKVIYDLQDVTDGIESDKLGTSKHEKALKRLASECSELGEELLGILKKLERTDRNSKWSALRTKLNGMRKKDDIASIKERLADYRSQIVLRLNMMLVDQNSSLKTQLDGLQQAMLHHSTPRSEELKKLQEALESALAQSTLKNAQELDELQIGLQEAGSSLTEQTITLEYIKSSLDSLHALARIIPLEKRILEHIYYDSMFERQEAIHAAEEGTFKWLLIEEDLDEDTSSFGEDEASLSVEDEELEDQQQDEKARAKVKLLTWLRSGSGTFHISGKAGSGKSTLMKLIAGHEITRTELGLWTGDNRTLVRSNHYFWSTGDKMQKSYEGLYRSILYDVLTKCPSLIQKVFQEQWNSLVKDMSPTATGQAVIEQSLFRPPVFKKAFEDLINHQLDDNYCLCVTIDGLDEFEGDSCDYWDLAEYLAKWSKKPNIKCLVSSRPYREFINTFPEDTRLRLHDVNKADIYTFASQKLRSDRHFHRVRAFYKDLVRKIVRLSEGVFLWAVLVVRVLLSSAAYVRFLHRSVADYLNSPEASNAITLTSDFDVEEAYTRLRVAETATFDEETNPDHRVTYGAREYMDAHLRILDIFLADGADADVIIRFDDHHEEKMLLALEDILDELRISYSAKFQAIEAGDMSLGSGKVKRADLPLWARRIPGVGPQDRLTDVGYFLSSNGPGRKAIPRCICSKDEYINLDPKCGIRKY